MTDYRRAIVRLSADSRGADRFYEAVQRALIDPDSVPAEAVDVADRLVGSVLTHPLNHEYEAWRGVRSAMAAFGMRSEQLSATVTDARVGRFMATSLSRRVVLDEFTRPDLAGGAVLMRIMLAPGTNVGWIAGAGAEQYRYQAELLVHPGMRQRMVGVDRSGRMPIVRMEVKP
ncbi:hypothetical protein [Tomitella fengzijianii]|uniref:hypothetical protein n=1 Tax=Tomitella fengzijianii TaxID=2597660 RepID=UPI00131B8970|nr:hypothetical protein [Tomitella fengzijianii]